MEVLKSGHEAGPGALVARKAGFHEAIQVNKLTLLQYHDVYVHVRVYV